ncbi:MAG: ATP-binding protein [Candidatus Limnocylindria bacterium]
MPSQTAARAVDPLLREAQRIERAIGWVRAGAAVTELALGPFFPNLSFGAVVTLGGIVLLYNAIALRASRQARDLARHRMIAHVAFVADIAALCFAQLLFSSDPSWMAYLVAPLAIIGTTFRFGTRGATASTITLSIVYVAIATLRERAFGFAFEPARVGFTLSIYVLTGILVERYLGDIGRVRAEREGLIRALRRRLAEDSGLARVMRTVATMPFTAEVVPAALRAGQSAVRFDRATVFAADEALGEYRVLYRVHDPEGDHPDPPRMRLGEGLIGAALREGRPLLIADVMEDPRYVPSAGGEPGRSAIIVPMRVGGKPVAVLSMSRVLPPAFGPNEQRLAENIAGLIAQVLENQRLFAEASEAEALRALDRLKDEFLTAVSHELRTPITVISGSLELLSRAELASDARDRLIEISRRHTERLARDVEDLLDLAQLQEARITLTREFVTCHELLGDVVAAQEVIASQRGQRLTVSCPEDVPRVLVDRRRMHQILGNLVGNALRYSPPGCSVTVSAERAGGELLLRVDDEGPGIPPNERGRVFDKFYRLSPDRDGPAGTGLGLAIAKTLVELHGGRIWVEDGKTAGSSFVVALPLEPAETSLRRPAA